MNNPVEFLIQLACAAVVTLAVIVAVSHESVSAEQVRSVMFVKVKTIQTQEVR